MECAQNMVTQQGTVCTVYQAPETSHNPIVKRNEKVGFLVHAGYSKRKESKILYLMQNNITPLSCFTRSPKRSKLCFYKTYITSPKSCSKKLIHKLMIHVSLYSTLLSDHMAVLQTKCPICKDF